MMRPEEVKSPNFTLVKGAYDPYDVDEYVKKVYETYIKLLTSNKQYSEKFSSVQEMVSEYKENKEALTELLIEAKTNAQKTKSDAEKTAKEIIDNARTKENEMLTSAKSVLENSEVAANNKYDEIVANANAKAKEIVDAANASAAKIVADAYGDAQKAKELSKKIVSDANASIDEINKKVSGMKTISKTIFAEIGKLLDSIEIPSEFSFDSADAE